MFYPDWNNAIYNKFSVSLNSSKTYRCPDDGFILVNCLAYGCRYYATINGYIMSLGGEAFDSYYDCDSSFIIVKKDDIVSMRCAEKPPTAAGYGGYINLTFVPFKR